MTFSKIFPLALLMGASVSFAAGDHAHGHSDHSHGNSEHTGHGAHAGHGAVASAVGMPAPADQASQTYQVTLTDDMQMHFTPDLAINQGDLVRFGGTNKGQIPHAFAIGSIDEQSKHREMMRAMPDMEHHDGTTVTLAPGETGEMGWHFVGLNLVEFSCNIPGHSEAGMKRNALLK
jgi:uncharacterized cupredoxin-like copper-binding protein